MNATATTPIISAPAPRGLRLAVLVLVMLAVVWFAPPAWREACRPATLLAFASALGALLWLQILGMTGGNWGDWLRPGLVAVARGLPGWWIVTLAAWAPTPNALPAWPDYESGGLLALRAVAYTVVFLLVARSGVRAPRQGAAAAGFIAVVFVSHLWLDDALARIAPTWHSTAFPLVWLSGAASVGLCVAVLAVLSQPATSDRLIDTGNLLLANLLFWSYVTFAQYLIIWSGNLPRETDWFLARRPGAWSVLPPAMAILNFVLPFGVLLSRRAKTSRRGLGAAAALVLAGQVGFAAWIALPPLVAAPDRGPIVGGISALVLVATALLLVVLARRRFKP